MTKYILNDKFRIKVTDRCNFCCPFCHSEGGKGAGDIENNQEFLKAIALLRPIYSRVHITGGEPFLYKDLGQVIDTLQSQNYKVSLTTNGYFSLEEKAHIIEKLEYINFSVHSFRKEYASKIMGKGRNTENILKCIIRNMEQSSRYLPVRINTVVSEDAKKQGLNEVLEFAHEHGLELKLVPEWSVRQKAEEQIKDLLEQNDFRLLEKLYLLPGSNVRERYGNKTGQIVEVKKIELFQPQFLCGNCKKKEYCQEGFSFLRLGGNPLYVQLCIFERKMGIEEFEIRALPRVEDMFGGTWEGSVK